MFAVSENTGPIYFNRLAINFLSNYSDEVEVNKSAATSPIPKSLIGGDSVLRSVIYE